MPRPSSHKAKVLLVSQNVLSKKAAPQMVTSMGHFKLVGSYRPRRLQFISTVHLVSSEGKFVSALIYALTYVGYLTTAFILIVWHFLLFFFSVYCICAI